MARKPDFQRDRNPLKTLVYCMAVIILLACVAGLYLNSRARHARFDEQVARAAENETEYVMKRREPATESESETETEAATEAATEQETETEGTDYEVSVLVLNGTQRPGVAGYWQEELEEAGYTNVSSASYNQEVEEITTIHAGSEEEAEPFLEFFSDGVYEESAVDEESIEPEEGEEVPEDCDVYIVIGRGDVPET